MGITSREQVFPTEEALQMATDAGAIGVWDLALPSNRLQWSNRCNEIFGLPLDAELRYEDFLERVHPEDRLQVDRVVQGVLDPKGTGDYELEYRIQRPDDEVRWVAAKGKVCFQDEDGERRPYRFMGTLIDRTEQKHTQNALMESEKMAVKGRLAASIAHEVRNPLDAVGNLLFLLETEGSEKKRAEYVALAQGELARALDIASHTLGFYREPVGTERAYDMGEFLRATLSMFQARLRERGVSLATRMETGLTVTMPHGELRQIVVNLIGNAVDALSLGGKLFLRARPVEGAGGDRRMMLTIADTGTGMTPEVRAHLFEAFYTTKAAKGNGIGLWLSLEIVKKHGGTIRVKSAPGRGTVFSLFLKAHHADVAEVRGGAADEQDMPQGAQV